jgi:hypothetical protein
MFKTLVILLVITVLLEDGSSMRKSEEERKEDEELAREVNRTLAEEEKKRQEEEDEKKKREGKVEVKKDGKLETERKDKGEALPCYNLTCPIIDPCQPCKKEECPEAKECGPCPTIRCKPCPRCEDPRECPPVDCPPVLPCPVDNSTSQPPPEVNCPEPASMSPAVAMAVGAVASLTITGVVAALGLLLRYVSPFVSGFLFISLVVLTWYLSSHYPETARDLGGRVVATLREATVALGHRVVEAIQRHNEQVGFPV